MTDEPRRIAWLQAAHLWADLVSKVLGGIGIVVAAWWTYTNFTVERTHDPTLEVSVVPQVRAIDDRRAMLQVDVFLRNVGKVAVVPRFARPDGAGDAGLEITIVAMEPTAHMAAGADAGGSRGIPWFDWTEGDGAPETVLRKRNLLEGNEDYRHHRYQLNPGVRYREPFACIVDRGRLYAIRARFWTDDGSVADITYVDTIDVRPSAAGDEGTR